MIALDDTSRLVETDDVTDAGCSARCVFDGSSPPHPRQLAAPLAPGRGAPPTSRQALPQSRSAGCVGGASAGHAGLVAQARGREGGIRRSGAGLGLRGPRGPRGARGGAGPGPRTLRGRLGNPRAVRRWGRHLWPDRRQALRQRLSGTCYYCAS